MDHLFRLALKSSYRLFQRDVVEKWILPHFVSHDRTQEASQEVQIPASVATPVAAHSSILNRVWFHAASVGELESLIPLIISVAKMGHEVMITILSESARGSLKNLIQTLELSNARILFSGYSPWEGSWFKYLEIFQPTLFVTAKYEAWPDLWVSLRQKQIPLSIVSVHARRSLRIARTLCQWMEGRVPEMYLFPCLEEEELELSRLFPDAKIQSVGEPRWDRVAMRAQVGNPRARALIQAAQNFKKPWGVIGSAWLEDLEFLGPWLRHWQGTLWVVPHRVDVEGVQRIEEFLDTLSLEPIKTRSLSSFQQCHLSPCLLVNEMGFLSELYAEADWAWVGGGFGAGIHSTIEPALHGIPIGIGPEGVTKFAEVSQLAASGQLTVLRDESQLLEWTQALDCGSHIKSKEKWIQEAKNRLGATEKILAAFQHF